MHSISFDNGIDVLYIVSQFFALASLIFGLTAVQSKKKSIGIRIPNQPIITNLVKEFGSPIMTTSLVDEEDEMGGYLTDPEEINERYKDKVDIIIDGGIGENTASTVVDCTDNEIIIVRQGKGRLE